MRASAGFTERVVRRIETGRGRRVQTLRWALCALLLAVLGAGAWRQAAQRRGEQDVQRRAESLRSASLAIERELETLRALAAGSEPSIYLTGTEGYEIVMGLSPWLGPSAEPARLTFDRQD
jgi:hypothetical protein